MKIRGEYWIIEGTAEFADGEIGDKNHEIYALEYVCGEHLESLYKYAKKIGIKDIPNYYSMEEDPINSIKQLFNLILLNKKQTYSLIEQNCGFDRETTLLMTGKNKSIDPRVYVMKRKGWIAVRSNNIELFDLSNKTNELYNGLSEIIEQEFDFDSEINDEEIEFNLFDYKTNKSMDLNLREIKEKKFLRPNTIPQTTYNKPLPLLKGKQYGREIWRGTSESKIPMNFKGYIENISLYHGTRSDFKNLEPRKARMGTGVSFTTNPEIAYNYALGKYKGGKTSGKPSIKKIDYTGVSFDFEEPVNNFFIDFVIKKLDKYINEFTPEKKKFFLNKIKNEWSLKGEVFYKEIKKAFAKRGTDKECKLSKSKNRNLKTCEKSSAFDLMPDLLNAIFLEGGYDSLCYKDENDGISHRCYFILDKSKI
jgi:hypothetical protein